MQRTDWKTLKKIKKISTRPNVWKERYCYKCHKIKDLEEFKKLLNNFRIAGVCKSCSR